MEEYRKALISVKNELIITNNAKEISENELIKESKIYKDVYDTISNYKLFHKNNITDNTKDLIFILLFRKLVLRRLSEKVLAYSFTISEIEYYIKKREEEIKKLTTILDVIKDLSDEEVKKYININNISV